MEILELVHFTGRTAFVSQKIELSCTSNHELNSATYHLVKSYGNLSHKSATPIRQSLSEETHLEVTFHYPWI